MKDRDKEPIIIENDYFFKLTISNKIMCVLIFLFFCLAKFDAGAGSA